MHELNLCHLFVRLSLIKINRIMINFGYIWNAIII